MGDLTIPGLLLAAVTAEGTVIGILWRRLLQKDADLKEKDAELKAEQKGRLQDRDRATRVHLKLLEKHSGTSLSDSEAISPVAKSG